jgi:hypothetical protein
MNCDNQTMIIKVSISKDNMKPSMHVKRRLKNLVDQCTKGPSCNVINDESMELGLRPT